MNIGIFVFDDAEVLDFAGPFEVFSVTGQIAGKELNVFTIGNRQGVIRSVNGLKVQPDHTIHDHPPVELLVVAGGQGTRQLLEEFATLAWLQQTYEQASVVISVCSAARLFAKLGLLDGKPFCTHHQVYEHVQSIAPLAIPMTEERFTQTNEKLYTSGGISAGIDLSFHILDKLFGPETANDVADYMEYRILKTT
ncbi:MAG: DJ-1/PfpI family protein [Bacteroidetes bacterium]|nr:DJ-1/PfpI family protein [Bacteroidota bacterium]